MKRILLFAAALVLSSVLGVYGAWAFGTKDVVQMHRDGVADSLVIQKIRHSGKNFHLDAKDMRELKREGVPDEIVSAMLATEDQGDATYGYGPYYYPRYGYPYYTPYYPRVVVGLGFSNYGYHSRYGYGYYGGGYPYSFGVRHGYVRGWSGFGRRR
jgi:hypothetical protein